MRPTSRPRRNLGVEGLRILWGAAFFCFCFALFSPSSGRAHDVRIDEETRDGISVLTANEHPWGRFLPGSWCRTQTVTWTFQDDKRIRNVNETKTTLESVGKNDVTLQEVSLVDLGGKRIETAPVVMRYDFFGEPIQDGVSIRSEGSTRLTVDGRVLPCEMRLYEQSSPAGKRRTTIWYSTQVYPYVLRVERTLRSIPTSKAPEETVLSQSICEVLESSALRLRKSKLGTYRLQTIRKSGNITTVTETSCSRHVPGGVLRRTVRELDHTGKEIRSQETRLINYYSIRGPSNVRSVGPRTEFPPMGDDRNRPRRRRSSP